MVHPSLAGQKGKKKGKKEEAAQLTHCFSCIIAASIQGKPVCPSFHALSSSGLSSHVIWRQIALPATRSKLGVWVPTARRGGGGAGA